MRLLVDRCAGRKLADWLREHGHDVLEVRTLGRDPGDAALLRLAADERRILVTIDTDFGTLIHLRAQPHAGLVRLPDVPPAIRIQMVAQIFAGYSEKDLSRAVVTVKGSRIRIARRGTAAGLRKPREA